MPMIKDRYVDQGGEWEIIESLSDDAAIEERGYDPDLTESHSCGYDCSHATALVEHLASNVADADAKGLLEELIERAWESYP